MSSFTELHLGSTIDREIARLDPDITSRKAFHHLFYARSTLSELRLNQEPYVPSFWLKFSKKRERFLNSIRNSASRLLPDKIPSKEKTLPFLFRSFTPAPSFSRSFQPPPYFSRGSEESNPKVNPPPILYLLEELEEHFEKYPSGEIIQHIEKFLQKKGKLSESSKGFVYLELPDEFIEELLPFIPDRDAKPAPYLGIYSKPDCPHIPVILVRERLNREIGKVNEIGEEIHFEILALNSTSPCHWPKVEKVWFLRVHSSRLQEIREKYKLSPRIGSHDFLIAIAVVYAEKKKKKKLPPMRINPAFIAA